MAYTDEILSELAKNTVEGYYKFLESSKKTAVSCYHNNAKMTRADGDLIRTVYNKQAIRRIIMSLDFTDIKHGIIDLQRSEGNYVVSVTGSLTTSGSNVRRKFAETFYLARATYGFFIFNDIFRFVGDEPDSPSEENTDDPSSSSDDIGDDKFASDLEKVRLSKPASTPSDKSIDLNDEQLNEVTDDTDLDSSRSTGNVTTDSSTLSALRFGSVDYEPYRATSRSGLGISQLASTEPGESLNDPLPSNQEHVNRVSDNEPVDAAQRAPAEEPVLFPEWVSVNGELWQTADPQFLLQMQPELAPRPEWVCIDGVWYQTADPPTHYEANPPTHFINPHS